MAEVVRVPRIQRETESQRRRRNENVDGSRASRLPAGRGDGGVHAPVGPRRLRVERKRIEGRFRALESVLSTGTFRCVSGGVRAGRELCHADGTDGDLGWQIVRINRLQVDEDRRVDDAARPTLRHAAEGLGPRARPDLTGTC